MATCGWPVKSGVEATNATTLTTWATRSRSPISDFTAAIALSAHCCAHSVASSGLTSPPTLPVTISSPLRIGSWPEVKTWSPDCDGRDVRRHRLGHLGHRQPELGEPVLGGAHASGRLK